MKLSAPKQITFWVAVALALIGLTMKLIPSLAGLGLAGWLVLIGFAAWVLVGIFLFLVDAAVTPLVNKLFAAFGS